MASIRKIVRQKLISNVKHSKPCKSIENVDSINRYRRICTKVDASIFDSALSHTRRSEASEKKEENTRVHFGANSPVDKFRVIACFG